MQPKLYRVEFICSDRSIRDSVDDGLHEYLASVDEEYVNIYLVTLILQGVATVPREALADLIDAVNEIPLLPSFVIYSTNR